MATPCACATWSWSSAVAWRVEIIVRLGILGGTFDPIHIGHLALAEAARSAFDLERVLFVPAAVPPHKPVEPVAAPEHRLAMVRLAVEGNPFFAVSAMELERGGPSYTVDTLAELRRLDPEPELYFVTGADEVVTLDTWREPARLLELAHFVAATRPGFSPRQLEEAERRLGPAARGRLHALPWLEIGLSSTDLRGLLQAGRPVRYLVPDKVAAYIEQHRLYRLPSQDSGPARA